MSFRYYPENNSIIYNPVEYANIITFSNQTIFYLILHIVRL